MFINNYVFVPGQSSVSCDGARMTQLDTKPSMEDGVKKDPVSHEIDRIPSGKCYVSTIEKDKVCTDEIGIEIFFIIK